MRDQQPRRGVEGEAAAMAIDFQPPGRGKSYYCNNLTYNKEALKHGL